MRRMWSSFHVGFGGLKAAHGLQAVCRITVIDKRNYHPFQPLLYQVATASLSPSPTSPHRSGDGLMTSTMCWWCWVRHRGRRRAPGDNRSDGSRVGYDYLVLATGARHSYFGGHYREPYAPGLKQIDDATEIRRRLLLAFEQAENLCRS